MLVLPEAFKVWDCDCKVLLDRERSHFALLLVLLPIGLLAVNIAVINLLAPLAFDSGLSLACLARTRRVICLFPQFTLVLLHLVEGRRSQRSWIDILFQFEVPPIVQDSAHQLFRQRCAKEAGRHRYGNRISFCICGCCRGRF